MMKTITALLVTFALLLTMVPAVPLQAQTVNRTTLTNAITTTTGTINITVASTTGMSASTTNSTFYVLIDAELMPIVTVVSATVLTVRRGGVISNHAANAEVRFGQGGSWNPSTGNVSGVFIGANSVSPVGSCTRATMAFLPAFKVTEGKVTAFDCPNNLTATTGQWVSWDYYPGTSAQMARTILGTTVTAYTALPSDYYIAITSVISNNTTITITLPCSSVPVNNTKVWIIGDEGGKPGTSGSGISIIGTPGSFNDTQQILAGFTAKAYRSNGTNCFRLF